MKVIFQSYNTCCQNETGGVQNRWKIITSQLSLGAIYDGLFNSYKNKHSNYFFL